MGPWRFISEQMEPLLSPTQREIRYVGRPESASPATGSLKRHQEEQAEIARDALTPGAASSKVRVMGRRKRS
jgi:2-oxoglutarate dehydrogenase E1 component